MRIFSFYTNQSSPFENGGAIYCTFFNSATVARITYTLKSCVLFHLECHLMEAIGSRQQVEKRIGTEFGEWWIASQTTTIATIKTARTWFIRSASAPENASVPLLFGRLQKMKHTFALVLMAALALCIDGSPVAEKASTSTTITPNQSLKVARSKWGGALYNPETRVHWPRCYDLYDDAIRIYRPCRHTWSFKDSEWRFFDPEWWIFRHR